MSTEPEDEQPIPPDIAPLAERLQRDGASWRRHLPLTEPLRQQLRALIGITTGGADAPARKDPSMNGHSPSPESPRTPSKSPQPPRHDPPSAHSPQLGPSRGLFAGATALVIVLLFVAVLAARAGRGRTSSDVAGGGTATATATAEVPSSSLVHVTGFDTDGELAFSASDMSVAFVATGNKPISRISGGTTTALSLPSALANGQFTWIDLSISPLSSQTLFATASMLNGTGNYLGAGCPVNLPQALAAPATGGNILASPASGSIPCQVQFVSTDGGHTWQIMHLPQNLLLGNASAQFGPNQYSAPPVAASNNTLYDIAGLGPLASGPGHALVTSTDGGATWQKAKTPFSSEANICTITSSPGGSVLYATTYPGGCAAGTMYTSGTPSVWRSTDGGASWKQLNLPTTNYLYDVVSYNASGPIYAISGEAQSHTASITKPLDVLASTDGGNFWPVGPTAGIPQGSTWIGAPSEGIGPVPLVLPDGTLVVPFMHSNASGSSTAFYELKRGAKAWKALVAMPKDNQYTLADMLVTTPDGGVTLYFVQTHNPNGPIDATSLYELKIS